MVAWLEDEEFEVAEASNGSDGLAEFERFHPDLALLDMNSPNINGIELCRRIRQSSQIPLVMFTSVADAADVRAAIAVGATDFVLRHTGFDELLNRISIRLDVERNHIAVAEFDEAVPAQALTVPEAPLEEVAHHYKIDSTGNRYSDVSPTGDDLWTWNGEYFGFREGENLWTYDGRHVGRFRRAEIYRSDGSYMGDFVEGRLIADWHKSARRTSSFTPSIKRKGSRFLAGRPPYNMMAGCRDFPNADAA